MICASVYLLVFIRNLLVHLAEIILLLQPLNFGGDYLQKAARDGAAPTAAGSGQRTIGIGTPLVRVTMEMVRLPASVRAPAPRWRAVRDQPDLSSLPRRRAHGA